MSFPHEVEQLFLSQVNSGNIRYQTLPVDGVAIADDTNYVQLFAAAGAPTVDYWLCGFAFSIAIGLVLVEDQLLFNVGWGGIDGPAVAPANIILTNWPVNFIGGAVAVGPFAVPNQFLPYPVRIPGGSRMAAAIIDSPVGGVAITAFCAILATVVGE